MADHNHYTRADIERYLNQQMTPPEMHAFEKSLLEDPMLNDAFEGFRNADATTTNRHLLAIEQEINNHRSNSKTITPPTARLAWWKVAAMVALVATASIIGYQVNTLNTDASVASVENTVTSNMYQADSIGPQDKSLAGPPRVSSTTDGIAALTTESQRRSKTGDATGTPITEQDLNLQNEAHREMATAATAAPTEEKALASQPATTAPANTTERAAAGTKTGSLREFKGRIVDPAGDPLPFATVHGKKDMGAVADANGNFLLRAPDSVLDVSVVALGYATTKARLNSNKLVNEIAVDEKEETELADIVVANMARKKKEAQTTHKISIVNKAAFVEPVQGLKHLEQYLQTKLNLENRTAGEQESASIELEFEVDKNGRPYGINVLKTSTEKYTTTLTELLQNGPLWKVGKPGSKSRVIISW